MKSISCAIVCLLTALGALSACSGADTVLVLSINQAKHLDAPLDAASVLVTVSRPADAEDALTPISLSFDAPTQTGATATAALFYERLTLPEKWHGRIEIQGQGVNGSDAVFAHSDTAVVTLVSGQATAASLTLTHD